MEIASPPAEPAGAPRPIAPVWHTVLLVLIIVGFSLGARNRQHAINSSHARVLQYTATLIWEWLLFFYCVWGARKRGWSFRELVGGRWREIEDVLVDIMFAGAFWVSASIVLSLLARAMHLVGNNQLEEVRRQLGFLVPRSDREIALWVLLSITAGICEEVIFRGYLQHQFASLTRNAWAGIFLSGLLFGAAHGYEGLGRMVLIAVYGMMFGLLAHFRRSLRPGMMAHAFHDGITGLVLHFFLK